MARIQFDEYKHTHDNNIRAVNIQVTAFSGAKELKKLENLGFLQVYSKKKQGLIYIKQILARLKTSEESDGGDFSVRAFGDIENDKSLKYVCQFTPKEYKKVEKSFQSYRSLKVRPTHPDLVRQKFHFVSTTEPIADYHVWKIVKTTDKELKPFIGKCLVQKVDRIHQTITISDKVFEFMLGQL